MLMRRLIVVLCPLILCLLTSALFMLLDRWFAAGNFFAYLLKGVTLGVCVALLLPLAGLSVKNTGLTGMLYIAAGLLLLTLCYQYLETIGAVRWPVLKAIISINGQVILIESTVMGFAALTAVLNRRRRGGT